MTDRVGLRTTDVLAAEAARLTDELAAAPLAGPAGRIAGARAAIDRLPAIVLHRATLVLAGGRLQLGLARRRVLLLLVLALAIALLLHVAGVLAVVMGLLAPLAAPLRRGLVAIPQRSHSAKKRQANENAQ
jgi:hypothetical protein